MTTERTGGKSIVVVLDGIRVSTEKNGIAPLKCALRDVVVEHDKVVVITIFDWKACTPSPANDANYCCVLGDLNYNQGGSGQRDSYIRYLHEEISRRTDTCMSIYKPYYDRCELIGVKFVWKTATDYQLPSSAIIVEEAKNAKATWIIMDRCFEGEGTSFNNFEGTNCNITFVGDDEEHFCTLPNEYQPSDQLDLMNTSRNNQLVEDDTSSTVYSMIDHALGMPRQLTWEMVSEITDGFKEIIGIGEQNSYKVYGGYLSDDNRTRVNVMRFVGVLSCPLLKAEKKAAISMYHKNIMRLLGYHRNENATVLVFPYSRIGTLENYLLGSRREKPKVRFENSMKIAKGIAQGLRYMHEECPRGPVAHRDLRPSNIFLTDDLDPQIGGFGKARWLQLDQSSPISGHRRKRSKHGYNLESSPHSLVTDDVYAFGILLLRLFIRRSVSRSNKQLVEWARPLLQKGAYSDLFDVDAEQLDPYDIYRVTCSMAQCIKPRQTSRPSISKVVSWLKGEISCAVEASPSPECTPNMDFKMYLSQPMHI